MSTNRKIEESTFSANRQRVRNISGSYSPGTIDNDLNARNTRNVLRPETFPISVIIVT